MNPYPRAIQPAIEQTLIKGKVLVLSGAGQLEGFECKWGKEKWRIPAAFTAAYPDSQVHVVNRGNVFQFN